MAIRVPRAIDASQPNETQRRREEFRRQNLQKQINSIAQAYVRQAGIDHARKKYDTAVAGASGLEPFSHGKSVAAPTPVDVPGLEEALRGLATQPRAPVADPTTGYTFPVQAAPAPPPGHQAWQDIAVGADSSPHSVAGSRALSAQLAAMMPDAPAAPVPQMESFPYLSALPEGAEPIEHPPLDTQQGTASAPMQPGDEAVLAALMKKEAAPALAARQQAHSARQNDLFERLMASDNNQTKNAYHFTTLELLDSIGELETFVPANPTEAAWLQYYKAVKGQ